MRPAPAGPYALVGHEQPLAGVESVVERDGVTDHAGGDRPVRLALVVAGVPGERRADQVTVGGPGQDALVHGHRADIVDAGRRVRAAGPPGPDMSPSDRPGFGPRDHPAVDPRRG